MNHSFMNTISTALIPAASGLGNKRHFYILFSQNFIRFGVKPLKGFLRKIALFQSPKPCLILNLMASLTKALKFFLIDMFLSEQLTPEQISDHKVIIEISLSLQNIINSILFAIYLFNHFPGRCNAIREKPRLSEKEHGKSNAFKKSSSRRGGHRRR